ncbi:MAG: mevalonate kinase [Gammaproteobacteria bacterium RBG_16_66_13]|nr:MAG: mevalonate kinase [Gammaproteobacteria bacterium RBG_16_66_13]
MTREQAPGKVILFGEHAVVYGRPAVAVPVRELQTTVEVTDFPDGRVGDVFLESPAVGLEAWLTELPEDDPVARITRMALQRLPRRERSLRIRIDSYIPIASGLGSGAAVSVALARALSRHLGLVFPARVLSELAFEVEKLHHGTPSGIDNTVISHEKPVYFVRGQPPETLVVREPFDLVIGDTGIPAPTAEAVGRVRKRWIEDRRAMERLFDSVGDVARRGRAAVEGGPASSLGALMDENQALLEAMGVSSGEIDRLLASARRAGALGAKLSGGGMGGNMIACVTADRIQPVVEALRGAGATRTIITRVEP